MSTQGMTPEEQMAAEIGQIIDGQIEEETPKEETVNTYEEQSGERVLDEAKRTQTRLLIVTTNNDCFNPESALAARIFDLAHMFAEIHVLLVNVASEGVYENARPLDNVWLYATNSRHGLSAYFDGKKKAESELEFANGFRADIILALDPYLSGVVARAVSKKFERPLQIHLTTNVFDAEYQAQLKHPWLKSMMADAVFKDLPSVRVANHIIERFLLDEYPELADKTEVIPSYVDLEQVKNFEPAGELTTRYPQYNLTVLFLGPLTEQSGVLEALDAVQEILRYPTASFLVLGEGPLKSEIESRVEALGLSEQVLLSPPGISELTALHESHFLIYPGGKDADDAAVMEAAAAGLPIVAGRTELVANLFTDDENALLCSVGDIDCLKAGLARYLNENALRKRIAREAKADIFERVELDVEVYKESIKLLIEKVLYDFETPEANEEVIEEVQEYPERPTS